VEPDDGERQFMTSTLRQGGFDVDATDSGTQALEVANRHAPELAILEVRVGDICGYEICRALREQHGNGVAIMFASADRQEAPDRVAGFLLGADDYVGKPLTADELLARAKALIRRVSGRGRGPVSQPRSGLTERELEVLRLLADGLDQATIAQRLFITPKTVSKHIEHILTKLPARSRAEAVAIAYRRGLHAPKPLVTAV
jgi:DNA-binding NarL/FixJ family response regulator